MQRALGVIPARFASSRFPGKPLAPLDGRPMVEHVWRAAAAAKRLHRVVVATEDDRIVEACERFGAAAMKTSADHPSGTDRVAEVLRRAVEPYDAVVNIQGDEPFVTSASLDRLLAGLEDSGSEMATLVEPLESDGDLFDPQVVKVVKTLDGRALYFSRAPIPYHRAAAGPLRADFREALPARPGKLSGYLKHQGIYAYRADAIVRLTLLPPSPLEMDESLEQLRALQAGFVIRIVDSDFRSIAVDTPADLERAAARLKEIAR